MVLLLRFSWIDIPQDCGVFSVANRATLVSFVGMDKIGIKV